MLGLRGFGVSGIGFLGAAFRASAAFRVWSCRGSEAWVDRVFGAWGLFLFLRSEGLGFRV